MQSILFIAKRKDYMYQIACVTQLIECQDSLQEKLTKLSALITIANCDHFVEHDEQTIKDYLWLLKDLIFECANPYQQMEECLILD